jgi:hypothetical protein
MVIVIRKVTIKSIKIMEFALFKSLAISKFHVLLNAYNLQYDDEVSMMWQSNDWNSLIVEN